VIIAVPVGDAVANCVGTSGNNLMVLLMPVLVLAFIVASTVTQTLMLLRRMAPSLVHSDASQQQQKHVEGWVSIGGALAGIIGIPPQVGGGGAPWTPTALNVGADCIGS